MTFTDRTPDPLRDSEVILAVNSFKPTKVPGPDGLHPLFYQRYWDILGTNTIVFCKDIFRTTIIPHDLNKTLLCLIPKINNAHCPKNFRLISLCNTLYKIITKIIANRLKPMLPSIIGDSQASFLTNRRASDHAILVQEVISHLQKMKGKEGNMAIKIDLEKPLVGLNGLSLRTHLNTSTFPKCCPIS